ncbi:DUF6056 family protein [Cronobacter sakazakii]|nr:DUF6056 family protein [Cronobacter sakazakii]ELY3830517.1 hypothetical protein [Cronobacter sakazakii]ELY4145716.1 hypothetical protein [Cronobacter sakazakii]MDT3612596.1 DUF6056 family protein [Cronobacter sakazakii]
MQKSNLIYIIIFALIFPVAYFTPMHSDDFRYYLMGLSPSAHFQHYMTWSGRVVADYISTVLLSSNNHFIASAFNAAGITVLFWAISCIPRDTKYSGSALTAISIFVLYWIANPNLGQTTFWIVGSANYLWTNLFIALFILSLFNLKPTDSNIKITGVSILGIIAGCSNENTSVTLIPIVITLCYIAHIKNGIGWIKSLVIVTSVTVGAAILILSPGNRVRALNHAFDAWKSMSIEEKIVSHFSERIDYAFTSSWPVIAFGATLLFLNFMIKGGLNREQIYFSGAFYVAFLFSNFVLVAAPSLPPRSFNGGFCFLLISFSFLVSSIDEKNRFKTLSAPLLVAMLFFIPSYYLVLNAYHRTFIQSEFREKSVEVDKASGMVSTRVPDFWFTTLASNTQRFDFYHNGIVFGKYYGMKPIGLISPPFEYSVLVDGKTIDFDCQFDENLEQSNVIIKDGPPLIKSIIAFEFNGPTEGAAQDSSLSYKVIYKDGTFDRKALSKYTIRLGGKNYFGFPLEKRSDDIKSIDIERYKPSGSISICHKNMQ